MTMHAPVCGFNHGFLQQLGERLRPTGGIDRMATMLRKKAIRRSVSFAALVALLLCQAAWAAGWPARHFAGGAEGAAVVAFGGCHDLSGTGLPDNAAPSPCDSAQLPSDAFKVPLFASLALGTPIAFLTGAPTDPPLIDFELAHPSGAPPPARLLYCKLLN